MNLTSSRKVFYGILVIAAIIILGAVFWAGNVTRPLGGALDDVALFLVKGQVTRIESFQRGDSFKFLVEMRADEVTLLQGALVGETEGLPVPGDMVRFDSPDSRINLLVEMNAVCEHSGSPEMPITTCEYELSSNGDTVDVFVVREDLSTSTVLPEYVGTTK